MDKKYVDFDTIQSKIEDLWYDEHGCDVDYNSGYDKAISDVLDILAEIPAADVQEVVRCKDCKYYFKSTAYNGYLCGMAVGLCDVDSDSYCSYGERMDGEEE